MAPISNVIIVLLVVVVDRLNWFQKL